MRLAPVDGTETKAAAPAGAMADAGGRR
jgi:hypothetical protein